MADGYAIRMAFTDYNAEMERALGQVLAMPATGITARPGVRPGPGLDVTIGGTPEAATVAAGSCVLTTDGETYLVVIPSPVALPLPTRPVAGSSRIHIVAAQIVNSGVTETSSVLREVDLYVEAGNAAPAPSEPTVAEGRLALHRLAQPSSGAVSSARVAPRTVAAGGILPVRNEAERNALAAVWTGLVIAREDTNTLEVRLGGAWHPIGGVDTGWVNVTPAAGYQALRVPQVRSRGPETRLRGQIKRANDAQFAANDEIALGTIPAGHRPPSQYEFQIPGNSAASTVRCIITAAGSLRVVTGSSSPFYVSLDGIGYWRD